MGAEILVVFLGALFGSIANLIAKYRSNIKEFKNIANYIIALILGFAVYGLYYYLDYSKLIPENFSFLALFSFSVLLGYALDEIVNDLVSLIKKS